MSRSLIPTLGLFTAFVAMVLFVRDGDVWAAAVAIGVPGLARWAIEQ